MNTKLITKLLEMLIISEGDTTGSNAETPNNEINEHYNEINEHYPIGKKIILRGAECGILYGTLISVTKGVYRMKDARRLWYWKCKTGFTLEDVANYGLHTDSKVTSTVPLCDVTDNRVSLLLPCSKEAIKIIESLPDYQP